MAISDVQDADFNRSKLASYRRVGKAARRGGAEPMGIAVIPIDTILLKATQTLSKSFQRKVKLSQPPNFVEESFRAAVGAINTNRGFRPEFAIGDLTLEFGLAIEKEASLPKTTSNVQTEYEKGDVQNTAQVN